MIAELLKEGKQNRTSLQELMTATGFTDIRKFRKQLSDERKQGAIILSCSEGGYYLPESRKEVESYVAMMSKEARSIFYMLKPARQYLKDTEKKEGA